MPIASAVGFYSIELLQPFAMVRFSVAFLPFTVYHRENRLYHLYYPSEAGRRQKEMTDETLNQNYIEVDKNMIIETSFPEAAEAVLRSVREDPFDLYNFCDPRNEPVFRRLPAEVAEAAGSKKLPRLARETGGGRVRFSTDSEYILLKARMPVVGRNSHYSLAASAGFDLYEDSDDGSRYVNTFMPPYQMLDGYEQIIRLTSRKLRYFTIHFPVHSVVSELYIGLQPDAVLGHGKAYIGDKPIIVYGSSIVHGTAASRPGNVYSNILCRRLNRNVVNLGFSGGARAEDIVMRYLAGLDMSLFVYDYDHNAPAPEYLRKTHKAGFDIIRAAQPELPIILLSRPNAATNPYQAQERKEIIADTWRAATAAGDKNVWFIDGGSFFRGKWEYDCTVDGKHPNDLGFMLMADGIETFIRRALNDSIDQTQACKCQQDIK